MEKSGYEDNRQKSKPSQNNKLQDHENYINDGVSKIIVERIKDVMNRQQSIEQAGYRKGFTTTDHIHLRNQVIEKTQERKQKIFFAFMDYTKAFYMIKHEYDKCVKKQGITRGYLEIIRDNMYV